MSRRVAVVCMLSILLFTVSITWAASLTPVGVLGESSPFSTLRALSPDGRYAVGASRDAEGILTPYVWSPAGGMQALPKPAGRSAIATGVDVRSAVGEIAIAAQVGGVGYRYNAPLETDVITGGTWTKLVEDPQISEYNALATTPDGNRYYIAGYLPGSCASRDRAYRYRGSTTQNDYWSNSWKWHTQMTSVAATGAVCGFDSSGVSGMAPLWTMPPAVYTRLPSETPWESAVAQGISTSGKWLTGGSLQAGVTQPFRWALQGTCCEYLALPEGSVAGMGIDVSDAGTVVGVFVDANGLDHAAIWDASGLWGSDRTPVFVGQWLEASGVDLTAWARLGRVHSISSDGTVIAGEGVWAADGSTRAWVATIPEPGTMLLVLAGVWRVWCRRAIASPVTEFA